jgi:hypothetical protein
MERCQAMPFDQKIPPSIFWDLWQAKNLAEGVSISVAGKGVTGALFREKWGFFASAAAKGLTGEAELQVLASKGSTIFIMIIRE